MAGSAPPRRQDDRSPFERVLLVRETTVSRQPGGLTHLHSDTAVTFHGMPMGPTHRIPVARTATATGAVAPKRAGEQAQNAARRRVASACGERGDADELRACAAERSPSGEVPEGAGLSRTGTGVAPSQARWSSVGARAPSSGMRTRRNGRRFGAFARSAKITGGLIPTAYRDFGKPLQGRRVGSIVALRSGAWHAVRTPVPRTHRHRDTDTLRASMLFLPSGSAGCLRSPPCLQGMHLQRACRGRAAAYPRSLGSRKANSPRRPAAGVFVGAHTVLIGRWIRPVDQASADRMPRVAFMANAAGFEKA